MIDPRLADLKGGVLRAKMRRGGRGGIGRHTLKRFVPRPEGQLILQGTRLNRAEKADRRYIENEDRFLARMRAIQAGVQVEPPS